MKIHIFHKYGEWKRIAHGTIYRRREDKSIAIGRTIEYERKCKTCKKVEKKYEDVIF